MSENYIELSGEELKKIQLKMLEDFDSFCKKNNIKYYLSGGTLLGAVRHKGFIPWDDDIDINIPRPEINKIMELTGGIINDYLEIEKPGKSKCFFRLCNKQSILISRNEKFDYKLQTRVNIDMFPVDGLPSNSFINYMVYLISGMMISFANLSYLGAVKDTSFIKRTIKKLLMPIVKLKTAEEWNKLVDRYASRRNYDTSKYVGAVTTSAGHRFRERLKKEVFDPVIYLQYENKMYPASEGYDTYLSNLYGDDYMDIPPIEKQKPKHNQIGYVTKELYDAISND